jgi:hypothetical protein
VESIDRAEKNTKLKKKGGREFTCQCKPGYTSDVNLKKGKDKYQALLCVDRSHKGKRLVLAFHEFSADQGAIA